MEHKLSPDSESGVRPELENLTVKEINLEGKGEEEEDDEEEEEDDEEASKHINEQRSEEPMRLNGLESQIAQNFVSEKQDHTKDKNMSSSKSSGKSTRNNKPNRNRANNYKGEDHNQRYIVEEDKRSKNKDIVDDYTCINGPSSSAKETLELSNTAVRSNKPIDQTTQYQFQYHHQDLQHYHAQEDLERQDMRHKIFENSKNHNNGPSSLLKGGVEGSVLADHESLSNSKVTNEESVRNIIQDDNSVPLKGIIRNSESDRLDHRLFNAGNPSSHTASSANIDPIVFCTPHSFGAGYFTVPNAYPAPNVEIKLFVGRVPRNIEEDDLRDLFKLYGRVVNVSVIREKSTGIHRGAALVTMESVAQADFALRELNSIKVLDELRGPLKVQYSTGEPERLGFESESCIPGVDQVKLFVGALPKNITEDEIKELFSPYGQINEIFIMREPHSGIGKGCAFVKYAFKEQGLFAIKSLHGALTLTDVNRPIEVRFASKNHQSNNNSLLVQGGHLPFGAAALNFNGHFNFGHHSIQKLHSPRIIGTGSNVNNILCNASTLASSTSPMSQQAPGSSKPSVGIAGTAYQFHNHQSGQHFIGCNSKGLSQSSSHHSLAEQLQIGSFTAGVDAVGTSAVQTGHHHPPCGRAITLFDHNGMAVATTSSTAAMFSRSRAVGLPIPASTTSATAAAAITANLMPRCIGMWKEYFTSDGKPYYHNELTQVTQWEIPPEFLTFRPNFSREIVGPPGANIFIFNVPYEWDKKSLVGLFCRFGNILSAHLMVDKTSGRNKGVAFVSYDNIHSAAEAVNHMNGFITEQGRKLKVSIKQGQEHFVQHLLKNNLHQGGYGQMGYMESPRNSIINNDPISTAISQNCNNSNDNNDNDDINSNNDVNVDNDSNNINNNSNCNNNNPSSSSGSST